MTIDSAQGYTRPNSVTVALSRALSAALFTNPDQRLGQLLINLTRLPDGSQAGLWNTYDEEWIRLLNEVT
jgi:hypothetical protein